MDGRARTASSEGGSSALTDNQGQPPRHVLVTCCRLVASLFKAFHTSIAAVLVRCVFLVTSLYIATLAYMIQSSTTTFVCLFLPQALVVLETFWVVITRCGSEYRWFCVPVFLYICASVPGLWVMQHSLLEAKHQYNYSSGLLAQRLDHISLTLSQQYDLNVDEVFDSSIQTLRDNLNAGMFDRMFDTSSKQMSKTVMLNIQLVLVVLLFGRWALPRVSISREQLSSILIGYLNMSADMLDLVSLLHVKEIREASASRIAIQVIWLFSLFQFVIVKTDVGETEKQRIFLERVRSHNLEVDLKVLDKEEALIKTLFFNRYSQTDLNDLLTTFFMQDGPYLAIRIFIVSSFNEVDNSDSIYFFMGKNLILVVLELYRSIAIIRSQRKQAKKDKSVENDVIVAGSVLEQGTYIGPSQTAIAEMKRFKRLNKQRKKEKNKKKISTSRSVPGDFAVDVDGGIGNSKC